MKKTVTCYICQGEARFLFNKEGADDSEYSIYGCPGCGLWQIDPVPSSDELNKLYENTYFEKRTDRGYDDYKSEAVRKSIEDTFEKNLSDLDFFEWEKKTTGRRALEIGCAGGYFVEYLKKRGWQSEGIEVSRPMVDFARSRGLNVIHGDFLKEPLHNYDLVSLWATIEHLPSPGDFVQKMSEVLSKKGRVIISTCHTGFWGRIRKRNWRFLNVPEHIYYFSRESLVQLFRQYGFSLVKSFTYGSGFTGRPDAGFWYGLKKKIADFSAKKYHLGDMIVCLFEKN